MKNFMCLKSPRITSSIFSPFLRHPPSLPTAHPRLFPSPPVDGIVVPRLSPPLPIFLLPPSILRSSIFPSSMASRGHVPSSVIEKSVQAPGMMRHGPFPGHPSSGLRPLEAHPPSGFLPLETVTAAEVLGKKIAVQEAEMEKLAIENQRLAATHVALRQEVAGTQHELQRVHAHVGSIHSESDMQIRGLLEKIAKAEAESRAAETVRKELQQAHFEGESLLNERQELTTEIQHLSEGLQKAKADCKSLPEMHAELDGLRQEHQKLRAAFEYEKHLNKEQVEQMTGMEKNLITMSKEIEKLRTEILNVEKAARVPNQYGGTYVSAAAGYQPAGQSSVGYSDQGYSQGGGYAENANVVSGTYPSSGYSHGSLAGYVQGYGMVPIQLAGGAAVQGANAYGTVAGAVYPDGSVVPLVPVAGGVQAGDGTNTSAVNTGSYVGISAGAPPLPPGPPPSATWR